MNSCIATCTLAIVLALTPEFHDVVAQSQPPQVDSVRQSARADGSRRMGLGFQLAPLSGISLRVDLRNHFGVQVAALPTFFDDTDKGYYGARFLYAFVDRMTYRLSATAGVAILHRRRLLPESFTAGELLYKTTLDQIYFSSFHAEAHLGPAFAISTELGAGYKNLGVKRDYGFLPDDPSGPGVVFGFGLHYYFR